MKASHDGVWLVTVTHLWRPLKSVTVWNPRVIGLYSTLIVAIAKGSVLFSIDTQYRWYHITKQEKNSTTIRSRARWRTWRATKRNTARTWIASSATSITWPGKKKPPTKCDSITFPWSLRDLVSLDFFDDRMAPIRPFVLALSSFVCWELFGSCLELFVGPSVLDAKMVAKLDLYSFPLVLTDPNTTLPMLNSIKSGSRSFIVILDARQGCWRLLRASIEQVHLTLTSHLVAVWALKPEPFWEKQHVDCVKGRQDCKVWLFFIDFFPRHVMSELQGNLTFQLANSFLERTGICREWMNFWLSHAILGFL